MPLDRRQYLGVAGAATLTTVVGCLGGSNSSDDEIQIAGGIETGANYQNALAIQSLLDDYSDELTARVSATNSPEQTYRNMATGQADAGSFTYDNHWRFVQDGNEPEEDIGEAFGLFTGYIFYMAVDDGIEDIEDLDGKTLWVLQPNPIINYITKELNDAEIIRTGPQEMSGEISRGNIDAFLATAAYTRNDGEENVSPPWQQAVAESPNPQPIPLTDDFRDFVASDQAPPTRITEVTLDAWGEKLEGEVAECTDAPSNNFHFSMDVDADTVEEVMTIIYEHPDEWAELSADTWDMSEPEGFAKELTAPLFDDWEIHPGAKQFFEEHGVDPRDHVVEFE